MTSVFFTGHIIIHFEVPTFTSLSPPLPHMVENNTRKILLLPTVLLVVHCPLALLRSRALLVMKSPSSYKTTCKAPV